MTVATNANVTKLYIATFDRAPDSNGLNYWVNQSGLSLEQIAQSFFDQPETQAKYAGKTNQEFVETIYLNVLGRPGEAAGIAYWVGELDAGHITKDQAILAVIGGAQGTDAELLENKTEVGIYYAEHNSDKDAFAVIDEVTLEPTSVDECKDWIDGTLPTAPSQYFVLDDVKSDYDLNGSAKDDVFVVEAFKTATIKGNEGSDTLDFQDFTPGVAVNLSTGLGPVGAAGTAMKFEWIENVRGTSGNDTLTGNSDHNILVAMGGADTIDGYVGNDRIMFRNIEDIAKSTINGGQNDDVLEITDQTTIGVGATTFAGVSDVEVLQVGYEEEGVASAATITVTDPGGVSPLNTFKEIRGTESYDKKGNAAYDVIQSANNLDVSNVKLTSIEELKATATGTTLTVGKDTLTSVKKVTGFTDGTTLLQLEAKEGDVFDFSQATFEKIDEVQQVPGGLTTTLIVNQSLINSFAANVANDGDGFTSGDFSKSTLKASGTGLDLGILNDGDTNFKVVDFGTAKEVTIGSINDNDAVSINDLTNLRSITGSDNDSDLLRILPDLVVQQDLTYLDGTTRKGISITKVERLDMEEISSVALMNANLTNVRQISGDDDSVGIDNDADGTNDGTFIDAGYETAIGGLDLKGKTLQDIYGFGNFVTGVNGTVTIDTETKFDAKFKSLDSVSNQTINLATAGSYDFSSITEAQGATVDFDDNADVAYSRTITYADLIKGSTGNDVVKGAKDSLGYQLGKGDDQFIGTNEASEVVEGGEGNDTIALGDNLDTTNPALFANASVLANSQNNTPNNATHDYVLVASTVSNTDGLLSSVGDTSFINRGLSGAYADGGANDDTITAGKGDDILDGGAGNDTLKGGDDQDILIGRDGADILSGGLGIDYLAAGSGDDLIEGNDGEDFLFGAEGMDVLRGDELNADGTINYMARDHFIFEAGDSGVTESGVDKIKDFFSRNNATNTDLDGNGIKGGAYELQRTDVLYHNWFATDTAGAVDGRTAVAVAGDNSPAAVVAHGTIGESYGTFFADTGNLATASSTSLEAAANAALDRVYTDKNVHTTLTAAQYASVGAQFEYGGKEYVVLDSYVTNGGGVLATGLSSNNFNAANDLIVEISDSLVSWSMSAEDVVVTRWDVPVL